MTDVEPGEGGAGGTISDPAQDLLSKPDVGQTTTTPDAQFAPLPPPRAGARSSAPCGMGGAKPDVIVFSVPGFRVYGKGTTRR